VGSQTWRRYIPLKLKSMICFAMVVESLSRDASYQEEAGRVFGTVKKYFQESVLSHGVQRIVGFHMVFKDL
jgi:hypothetical protein